MQQHSAAPGDELRRQRGQQQATLFPHRLHHGKVGPGLDLGIEQVHADLLAVVVLLAHPVQQLLQADQGRIEAQAQRGGIPGFESPQHGFERRQSAGALLHVPDLRLAPAIGCLALQLLLPGLQPLVARALQVLLGAFNEGLVPGCRKQARQGVQHPGSEAARLGCETRPPRKDCQLALARHHFGFARVHLVVGAGIATAIVLDGDFMVGAAHADGGGVGAHCVVLRIALADPAGDRAQRAL